MLGGNAKAGIDMKEFVKYLFATVVPLYPDVADTPGKCIAMLYHSTELT